MDIGEHETLLLIAAIISATIAVVTKTIDTAVYGSIMGGILGYSFHAIPTQQAAIAATMKES